MILFAEDSQSAGPCHRCQGLSNMAAKGLVAVCAAKRLLWGSTASQPDTQSIVHCCPSVPICQLATLMFRGAIMLAGTQTDTGNQTCDSERPTTSLPMDRSGWKFPAIRGMPIHSALLQSTFPNGTHTLTQSYTHCINVCVDVHAHYFGSCDLAH